MLIRSHDDATDDEAAWRAFVDAQGFGHFVATAAGDLPVVVPTQFELDGDRIVFHLAKPNPVFACLEADPRCVMSVAGDWAYIPGLWKAIGEEDPRRGIPTTYYGAVQLIGTATILDDAEQVAAILRTQLGALEQDGDYVDPIEHGAMLRGIRGISVRVDEVRAKLKYGGNVDVEHRSFIATRLAERNGPGDRAARAHINLVPPS